jgi:hypothetical protein
VYKEGRHGQDNGSVTLKGICHNTVKELENTPISPFICSSPNVSNSQKGPCPVFSVSLDSHEHSPRFCTTEHITRVGTGVFLGGRLSVDKVVEFGGISPPLVGARSSQRIKHQTNADATQMERAHNLAMAKDSPYPSGNIKLSKYSLVSIPDDVFAHRANKMGVSLGGSPSQIHESIRKIKEADNK